jgi:hypothetical protein
MHPSKAAGSVELSAPPHSSLRYIICRKGGSAVEWHVTGKYEITEFVGEGSYGQVCRARLTAPPPGCPETVIIKRIVDVFQVTRSSPAAHAFNLITRF